MKPELQAILVILITFILLEFFLTNLFRKPKQKKGDGTVELISTLALFIVTQPLILLTTFTAAGYFMPDAQDSIQNIPIIYGVILFLLFDDLTQYWWHRLSHTLPWLYNLHRPHHDAEYISVRMTFRNGFFYYWLMPSIWLSSLLIYLGLGWIYAGYIVVKMFVIISAHSDVRWDTPLYKIKWLSPVMWVVERTISTPTTHSAHHGKHASDGVTNYKGNYGNLLFFWDVLFGTAKITRKHPEKMGVENLLPVTVSQQLFWPLVPYKKRSKDKKM